MKFKSLAIILLSTAALASCSSTKTTLPYFTDISNIKEGTLDTLNYAPTLRPDDELVITYSSSVPEAIINYNLPLNNPTSREELKATTQIRLQTFVVNPQGNIVLPVIGEMHVQGLTTDQLRERLTEIVKKDVADVVVRVELVNFQVVVAGEVARPSTIKVTRSRFSILDALSAAGDLTPYGERSNILIIREKDGKRVFAHLDLNSSELLTSEYFYLQQNDYIYVEPNDVRQANSHYNQDNAYKLQVTSTIVSATSVIASLVIALTVK